MLRAFFGDSSYASSAAAAGGNYTSSSPPPLSSLFGPREPTARACVHCVPRTSSTFHRICACCVLSCRCCTRSLPTTFRRPTHRPTRTRSMWCCASLSRSAAGRSCSSSWSTCRSQTMMRKRPWMMEQLQLLLPRRQRQALPQLCALARLVRLLGVRPLSSERHALAWSARS